jgi:hypothetical protein
MLNFSVVSDIYLKDKVLFPETVIGKCFFVWKTYSAPFRFNSRGHQIPFCKMQEDIDLSLATIRK